MPNKPVRPHIAVIEDDARLRDSLAFVLESRFRVSAFDSAEAFQASGVCKTVSGVIADINLPGEDGVSLAKRKLRDCPGKTLVLMSGREIDPSTLPDRDRVTFLTKPVDPGKILEVFDELRA